jgi:hypothetical protein
MASFSGLPDVLKLNLTSFLGFSDSLPKLAILNRGESVFFKRKGFFVPHICISVTLLNKLIKIISLYPKLSSLEINFPSSLGREPSRRLWAALDSSADFTKLTKLSILRLRADAPSSTVFLQKLLEKTPQLTELAINILRPIRGAGSVFTPFEEQSIPATVSKNLKGLTKLEIAYVPIRGNGVLELLQCSQSFISVNLTLQRITDAVLKELVRSENLAHLNLFDAHGAADYHILARCHQLERFSSPSEMTEDAFLSIISANPGIIELSLDACPQLHTDKVLEAIVEKLPNLRFLFLYCIEEAQELFTDKGFVSLIRGCQQLQTLHLGNPSLLSIDSLIELENCLALKDLQYDGPNLIDSVLDAITNRIDLTHLTLGSCEKLSEASLRGLQKLRHLRKLELRGALIFTDEVLRGIANCCEELEKLSNYCWQVPNKITAVGLGFIRTALEQKRLNKLRNLDLMETDIPIEVMSLFLDHYPLVKSQIFSDTIKLFKNRENERIQG